MNLFRRRKAKLIQRVSERQGLSLLTTMRGEAGLRASILIRDLSDAGFCAECLVRFRPGSIVVVDLPGLRHAEATVEWSRRNMIGVSFRRPVALAGLLAGIGS